MSRTGIAFLALRLAAIYCWLKAILLIATEIPFVLVARGFPGMDDPLRTMWTGPVLLFATGGALFIWAPALANRMFPGPAVEPREDAPGMGGLALRVMGIWVGTWALETTANFVGVWLRRDVAVDSGNAVLISYFAPAFTFTVISAWLILAGPKLARWLLRERAPPARNAASMRVQTIAFSIVGVLIFASGFAGVVGALMEHAYDAIDATAKNGLGASTKAYWGSQQWIDLVRVILGAALFLGSNGLAWYWRRAQTAGVPATASRQDGAV
jgi:hypothetical protein